MKQSRFTQEQIIGVLEKYQARAAVADHGRKHGIGFQRDHQHPPDRRDRLHDQDRLAYPSRRQKTPGSQLIVDEGIGSEAGSMASDKVRTRLPGPKRLVRFDASGGCMAAAGMAPI